MGTFRCFACHFDFETDRSDRIDCPECGADGDLVARVETIHLDAPRAPGRGVGYAACDRSIRVGTGPRFSGETTAVTCPACKQTEAFRAGAAAEAEGRFPAAIPFKVTRIK